MKNKIIFGILVIVVVLGGIGLFLLSRPTPVKEQAAPPEQELNIRYTQLINLLKNELYAIDKNGYETTEIKISNFNEHSLTYSKSGFGSGSNIIDVYCLRPLSISFIKQGSNPFSSSYGGLTTYICKSDEDLNKLISVYNSESYKAPTLRHNDFLIVSTIMEKDYSTKVENSKRIFDELTGVKELPVIFSKYLDIIAYLFNSQDKFGTPDSFPLVGGLTYKKHIERIYSTYEDNLQKTRDGIAINFPWDNRESKVQKIIIMDFNPDYFKIFNSLESNLIIEPVSVNDMKGCLKEVKETTSFKSSSEILGVTGGRRTIIQYHHALFFKFGNMFLYLPFSTTSEKLSGTLKNEWLNESENILKYIFPALDKDENESCQ